jgi:hypothetical protein
MEATVKRFTVTYSEEKKEFLRIVTHPDKYAKVPSGYKRCGKSFLGLYYGGDDCPPSMRQVTQ